MSKEHPLGLKQEVLDFSVPPMEHLQKIELKQNLRILLLGENEQPGNAFRKMIDQFVRSRQLGSFTHVALEWASALQPNLDAFIHGGPVSVLLDDLYGCGYRNYFVDDDVSRPDPHYSSFLESARSRGLKMLAIDEMCGINGGYSDRDATMALAIRKICLSNSANRVLFVGGSRHIYHRRFGQGRFLTVTEHLMASDCAQSLWSVAGITSLDAIGDSGFMKRLACRLLRESPLAIDTNSCSLRDLVCCYEARCAGGSCCYIDDNLFASVPNCSRSISSCAQIKNEPRYPVLYGDWNTIIWAR